jgi:ankyrin repeat protein
MIRRTPLHYAAASGSVEAVEKLISKEADIDATTSGNETPLMKAAFFLKTECVRLLLSKGANPVHEDLTRKTAYNIARMVGSDEISKILEDATSS